MLEFKKNMKKIFIQEILNLRSWTLEADGLGSNPGLSVTSSVNLGKVAWLS